MKKKIMTIALLSAFSLMGTNSYTNELETNHIILEKENVTTSKFKVYGNCGMCKNRIQGALDGVAGVESAVWDIDSKIMTVNYDKDVISLEEIKQKIADVGHDTDNIKATKKTYNKLHGCCQYDRE